MSFCSQTVARHAPGALHRLTQSSLFLPFVFATFCIGAWKGILWIVDNAAVEGESSPFQKIMIERRLQAPNDLGPAGALGAAERSASAPASSRPTLERPDDVEIEEAAEPVSVGAGQAEEEVREWRLRGGVYDLVTLKPVPRCAMTFADEGSTARLRSSTDSQGRYRVTVPALKNRGYAVALQCQGYASSYLNPGAEGVRAMSEEDRRSLASDLAKALDPPYTLQAYASKPLITDFFVAPLPK